MPLRSVPTVWLLHLSHNVIKTARGAPGVGGNALNILKIRQLAAILENGREAASVALQKLRHTDTSTLGDDVRVVPVTLGDQNLTAHEVLKGGLFVSLVPRALFVTASEGVVDMQGRLYQDLILVDADAGVTVAPRIDFRGFDLVHQAVRARLSRNPAGTEAAAPAAASAEAALPVGQAAASTRDAPASPPSTHVPTGPAGDAAAVDSEESPVATEEGDVDYGVDDSEPWGRGGAPTSRAAGTVPCPRCGYDVAVHVRVHLTPPPQADAGDPVHPRPPTAPRVKVPPPIRFATAADVVQALDDDARAVADMECDEAAVALAVGSDARRKVLEEVLEEEPQEPQEHYGLQDAKVLVQEE